jgi:hypothetical protein
MEDEPDEWFILWCLMSGALLAFALFGIECAFSIWG